MATELPILQCTLDAEGHRNRLSVAVAAADHAPALDVIAEALTPPARQAAG